jgi:hypothetical protein
MKRLVIAAGLALALFGCSGGSPLSVADADASTTSDAGADVAPSCRELASADCNRRPNCQALYCPNCNWGQSFVGCERQGGGDLSCNPQPCAATP